MKLNQVIIQFLNLLQENNKSTQFLKVRGDKAEIFVDNSTKLLEINEGNILLQRENLEAKLINSNSDKTQFDFEKIKNFITSISTSIVRLNHVGISYYCDNTQVEIEMYKQTLKDSSLHIYQEQSESKDEQWFFIGNTKNWEAPLCEVVLNSSKTDWYKDWLPAFQVDIDTSLSIEELEVMGDKYFGKGFWKWKLDIPNYGVVLAMAILGEINGVKVTFGVGTKLRNTVYHRESMKKVV